MDMFEEAKSLAVMMKMRKLSQTEAAKMLGVSQSYVANKLRLLQLNEELRRKIVEENLTERHARALLRLDETKRCEALTKICDRRMSVAESEALIDLLSMSNTPRTLGKADSLKMINGFIDSIKRSLNAIRSSGASAISKISYEKSRIYISICIDENGDFSAF